MQVFVIGGGGREHALAWKIAQSPLVSQVHCAPGNPGTAAVARNVAIAATDFDALIAYARDNGIGLAVIGPEDPLAKGIVDRFQAAGIPAFGPTQGAAELEASKAFAKDLMRRYGIPTAAYGEFENADDAKAYVRERGAPIVVKADGLAAGKGVTVAQTVDDALAAIDEAMVSKAFGAAGSRLVIEECLVGEEASILALTDGERVLPLASSQDHKAAYDGDTGPNTGGMGAYSPAPVVTDAMMDEIVERILLPCVRGMAQDGRPYRGMLYAGLMITAAGPQVIEFNCRFGDPETQVVLPRMTSDLVPLLQACAAGSLEGLTAEWGGGACVSVVMASGGYPGGYDKGKPIAGIAEAEAGGALVFHAGTAEVDGALVTNGGRVLNVTATGADIAEAVDGAYAGVRKIAFDGAQYRSDIAAKALRRLR